MGDRCVCYTDNIMLLLVSGVFLTLLGMIVGVFYLTIHSMTDSVEYAESTIPTYVSASGLIVTGIMVMVLFKNRHKLLVLITLCLVVACIFFCVCSAVLGSLQVIPFLESLTHCVSRPVLLECQCYIIENDPGQNITSNIIDVGDSRQFTFYGTKSCTYITNTIIDIVYTECVIYVIGAVTTIMTMIICILLLCGRHHHGKRLRDGDFEVLTDDRSTTTTLVGRTPFSRRILIPGHSYTLGSRQSQNFLRPPYASYFQDEDHMYLLSAMNGNNNRSPGSTIHRPPSTMTTSLGRSSDITMSRTGSSIHESTRRTTANSGNDSSNAQRRISSVSGEMPRRNSSRMQRRSSSQNTQSNSNTTNFSAIVGLHDLQSGRQQPRRIVSQSRNERPRPVANGNARNGQVIREGYMQGYDGNVVPIYAVPGSSDVFVNIRDIQSVQMPYTQPYDFPPMYSDPPHREDPPPYSPGHTGTTGHQNTMETSNQGNETQNANSSNPRQQDATLTSNHGNQARNSSTSLPRPQTSTSGSHGNQPRRANSALSWQQSSAANSSHGNQPRRSNSAVSQQQSSAANSSHGNPTRSSSTSLPRQRDAAVTTHHGNRPRSSTLPSAVPLVDSVYYMTNVGQNNLSETSLHTTGERQNFLRNITEDDTETS